MGVPILEDTEVSLLIQDPDGLLLEVWEPEDLENYHRAPADSKIDRDQVRRALEAAFRQHFPTDTVDISDGYRDNIHLLVVSRRFDEMSEAEKDDMMWTIIRETELTGAEKSLVSLVLAVSPGEIK